MAMTMQKRIVFSIIIVIVFFAGYLFLTRNPKQVEAPSEFKGPTGPPSTKGPTSPPPGN